MNQAIQPQMMDTGYLLTGEFMGSFVHVFEMRQFNENKPEYAIEMVMDPNDPTIAMMSQLIQQKAFEKWGNNIPAGFKSPIRDGNERAAKYPELAGKYTVKASDKNRKPLVIDRDRAEILDRSQVYSGAKYRAVLDCYAYDKGGNGVAFGLKVLQKLEDGQPLSGGPNVDVNTLPVLPPVAGGMAPQMGAPGMPQQTPQAQPGVMPQQAPQVAPQAPQQLPGAMPQQVPQMAPQGAPGMPQQTPQVQPMQGQPYQAPQGQPGVPQPMPGQPQQQTPQGQPGAGQGFTPVPGGGTVDLNNY